MIPLFRLKKIRINPKLYQVLLLLIIASSCVPQKKLIYLQDKGNKKQQHFEFRQETVREENIRPGDELYIRVTGADDQLNRFSLEGGMGMADVTLISYTVREDGIVKLPYLGEINLADFTLKRASDTIESLLTQYLPLPSVDIKFINKNITILGEVNNPGIYTFYDKNISIFQAIGYANDITTFGNRKKVMLLREEDGKIHKNYIDLTGNDVLSSDMYVLRSNDVVYVQPLNRKKWGMETYPYTLLFTMITTVMMVLTYMRYPVF
jgi:polysaccharide export outer membrane protein